MPSRINNTIGDMSDKTGKAMKEIEKLAGQDGDGRSDVDGSKIVSIRLSEYDHRRIKALFAANGVKLASGLKFAAMWVAELAESGALKVTQAGIIDRRFS